MLQTSQVKEIRYGYFSHEPDCPPDCQLHGPLPKQRLLHTLPHREKAFGGAVGGSKSCTIANEVIRLAITYPGTFLFVARRHADDLRTNTMQEILKFLPQVSLDKKGAEWSYSPIKNELVFRRFGSYVKFDNLEKWKATFGPEYQAVFIDQAEEVAEEAALALLTRLRLSDETRLYNIRRTVFRGKLLTPEEAGFRPGEIIDPVSGQHHVPYHFVCGWNPEMNWVKEWFYDDANIVEYDGIRCYEKPNRIFIPAYQWDNPHLSQDYINNMNAMPEEWRQRYVQGMFIHSGEAPFPSFDPATHVIKPFDIPDYYLRYRAIDHGSSKDSACACLWGAVSGQFLFVYMDYLNPSAPVPENVMAIMKAEQLHYSATFIDPSTLKGGANDIPLIDQYRRAGISALPTGNNIDASVALINTLLRVDPNLRHPITGEMGSPRLFIFDTCTQTIKQFQEARWRRMLNGQLTHDLRKRKMDLVDALRYLVMGTGLGIRQKRPQGGYKITA